MEFKIIVLAIVVFSAVYSILLNVIRYRSAKNPTPESVKDIYDSETYEKWRRYSAEHCRLDIISTAVSSIRRSRRIFLT
jgi:hypothetical protein